MCADAPQIPDPQTATPVEIAELLVAERVAGDDCRHKLRSLAAWATTEASR